MINSFNNLIVKEPTIFSDHSQLICWVNIAPSTSPQTNSHPQGRMFNLPKQFIWIQTSNETFLNVLRQDEFLSRLTCFEKTAFPTNSEGIDLATVKFTNIINDICLRSLRLACKKKEVKDTKNGLTRNVYL